MLVAVCLVVGVAVAVWFVVAAWQYWAVVRRMRRREGRRRLRT